MELKPGYKQTEVGVIPEDWEITNVGDAFEIHNTLRFPISNAVRETMPGPYPYYGPTSIQGYINEYRVEGEYALIGEDGDHFLKWQTQPMTLLVQGKFNVNNHAHLVRGTKNLTSWFYYYFSRRDLTPFLTRQGASRYKLTKKKLAALPCAIPAENVEQAAIAEALSDVDALIQSLDQLIAKKRQIKQGAMQELLNGKRRLPGFNGAWEVKCLNELAEIDPEQLSSNTQPDYEFKYISLEDVDFGALRGHSLQVFDSAPSRARRRLRIDDLLVSTVRPNLKSHLWFRDRSANWVCSTGFSVVRCFESLSHPGYVFAHFFAEGVSAQIDALLTGSNYPAINSRDVRQLQVPVPSLEEQTAIATVLSDMDTELAALESRLTKARQIKQGMMQELLTGRIRLL